MLRLGLEVRRDFSDSDGKAWCARPDLACGIALATYGTQTIHRAAGENVGPEILVLWRKFAWTPQGSPIRGFKLDADLVLRAEQQIADHLSGASP